MKGNISDSATLPMIGAIAVSWVIYKSARSARAGVGRPNLDM